MNSRQTFGQAGAFMIVIAAGAACAQADVVHRVMNTALPTWNLGPSHRLAMVSVDLNGDGQADGRFHYSDGSGFGSTPGCANRCPPTAVISEMIHVDEISISGEPLEPNVPVDPSPFAPTYLFAVAMFPNGTPVELGSFGDFSPTPFDGVPRHGTSLIGFSFADGFGWMRIRSSRHEPTGRYPSGFTEFRLIDIAYQTDWTGTILPDQIPTPAGSALVFVAAMTMARRRRR